MGVCPTSPHVFCGLGEGIRPCPSWHSVGGAPGVRGQRPSVKGCTVPVRPEQEPGLDCRQKVRPVPGVCWTPAGLLFVTGSVHYFYGQNFSGQPGAGRGLVRSYWVSSLLFTDDVVLLASSSQDLQDVLWRFAAKSEAAGMRISTSKSGAMVLNRKKVACSLRVELLPQVEEFKYPGVLSTSEVKMEHETDRWTGAVAAVIRSLYQSVVVSDTDSDLEYFINHQGELVFVPMLHAK